MGDTRHGIAIEVARLQGDISAALSRLEGLPDEDPRYEAAFNDVIAASSTLLAYETQIPAKLQEPHRKASKKVMQWASWAHLGGAGLLALAPLTGWITWWWLVVAAIQAAVGFLVSGLDPKTGDHYNLRFSAGALTLVTILIPLLIFNVLSGWFWIAAVIGWFVSCAVVDPADNIAGSRGRT